MKALWVEKYRPKDIDGYVFADEAQREQVESWIKAKSIPHILLSGSPGTGKTTLAKILINALDVDEYDVLYANGSKEARKLEWVDKLIGFCQTMPYGDVKIVLIDEADYMNIGSVQPALRNLMEDYSETVRFILTCNYPNKIMPAIHSRCQGFHINKSDKLAFTARVIDILDKENVSFGEELATYIDATYPDFRKCIQTIQQNSTEGVLRKAAEAAHDTKEWRLDFVDLFKKGKVKEARLLLCSQAMPDEMQEIFRWMYDNLDIWGKTDDEQDEAIKIIAKGVANHSMVADYEINLSATIIELGQI